MTHDEIIKVLRTRLPKNERFRISSDISLVGHSTISVSFGHCVGLEALNSYFIGLNCVFQSRIEKDNRFGADFDSSFIVAHITVPD